MFNEIHWYDEELRGEQAVRRMMEDALSEDVFESKAIVDRETFLQNDKGYVLEIFLPNAVKENLDLYQAANAVIVKADNFKRNIPLPNVLCSYGITGAKYENERLYIQFEKGGNEDEE